MKRFFGIVLAGLLVFIAAAIAQEWPYFSTAWFGNPVDMELVERESLESEAVTTVRETLAIMTHLYSSGGDPRFADRMPVAPELLEEIQADIRYLERNRRIQDSRLQKFEPLAVSFAGSERAELRTREFWIHRTFWSNGSGEADPPRSVILFTRYPMARENKGWRILGREFDPPNAE